MRAVSLWAGRDLRLIKQELADLTHLRNEMSAPLQLSLGSHLIRLSCLALLVPCSALRLSSSALPPRPLAAILAVRRPTCMHTSTMGPELTIRVPNQATSRHPGLYGGARA